MKSHYQIVVIGGGTGGIMTASMLKRKAPSLDIAVIDPADTHYYQPAFTLVGAGTYDMSKTHKPMKDVIPSGVEWIKDEVTGFKPEENKITLKNGNDLGYDYLVVSPGLVYDNSLVEGLDDAFKKGAVCSNYTDPEFVWKSIQNFKGGNAIFTQPTTPIKCGGAPQKIMYLFSDYLRKNNLASKTNVEFITPGTVIFGVKEVAQTLNKVLDRYNIDVKFYQALVKIDADKKIAYFKNNTPAENPALKVNEKMGQKLDGDILAVPFDFLHLAPPQTAPKFVKESNLVNAEGWLDVHHGSMQHNKYPNIFGLGDVAALPTAKTGAAIRKQVPIVVDNIQKLVANQAANNKSYNGYSSCPLVTGYGKMVLAEFDYQNNFTPDPKNKLMLVFDSSKEHWRLWMLKKYGLPYLYWNKMLKGKDV